MAESTQHKLDRVRPPRVQITYDVETGDAFEKKELPFVVGVISDLAGNPADAPPAMKDRKFVEIDRDNFNDVLKSIKPRLAIRVPNTLKDDGSELSVELNFQGMDDFGPEAIVNQVEPLRKLLEVRGQLKDLQSRTEGNDRLEEMLDSLIDNDAVRDKLKDVVGAEAPSDEGEEG